MTPRRPWPWFPVLAGVLALATWADFVVRSLVPSLNQAHWPGYWAAARLALEGRTEVLYEEAETFGRAAVGLGSVPDIFNTNAPITLLPLLPFGLLAESSARASWLLLSMASLALAWGALLLALRLSLAAALSVTAMLPLFQPLRENLTNGQAYLLVFAVLAAGTVWAGSEPRMSRLAGIAVGAVGIVKLYYGGVLLLVAAASRQWRVVVAAGVVIAIAALVTLGLWGPGLWADWLAGAMAWRTRPETAVTAFQTINGLLSHLLRFDPRWNPGPVIDQAGWIDPLWAAAALVIGGVTVAVLWRASAAWNSATGARRFGPFALGVLTALLLSPIAEDYHFVLAVLPIVVAGTILATDNRPSSGAWGLFVLAVVLLGAPWRFNVPVEGWAAVLHYPRVYGGLILWGLLASLLWRGNRTWRGYRR